MMIPKLSRSAKFEIILSPEGVTIVGNARGMEFLSAITAWISKQRLDSLVDQPGCHYHLGLSNLKAVKRGQIRFVFKLPLSASKRLRPDFDLTFYGSENIGKTRKDILIGIWKNQRPKGSSLASFCNLYGVGRRTMLRWLKEA